MLKDSSRILLDDHDTGLGVARGHPWSPTVVPSANPADAPAFNVIANGDFSEEPQKLGLNLHGDPCMASMRRHSQVKTPWRVGGETPVLQYNFNSDTLSVAAGITFYNFYFRLYQGSVKSAQVVDFLQALLRHIPGRLLIIWDRLSAHRSKVTRDFIAEQGERLWVEYLPGYAPELNPVEYIWAYWKQHALPNVCPRDYWSLDETARRTLKRMRRRPRLITAFWQQAELFF
jgi:transposase